jgi:hypothetical protein
VGAQPHQSRVTGALVEIWRAGWWWFEEKKGERLSSGEVEHDVSDVRNEGKASPSESFALLSLVSSQMIIIKWCGVVVASSLLGVALFCSDAPQLLSVCSFWIIDGDLLLARLTLSPASPPFSWDCRPTLPL